MYKLCNKFRTNFAQKLKSHAIALLYFIDVISALEKMKQLKNFKSTIFYSHENYNNTGITVNS